MAFTPYTGKPEYNIEELVQQIEKYKDVHGEKCEYVRCEHRNADYSVLDRGQRAYYLYWRDELSKGNCLKADRGYVKLRMVEIINSDMEPRDAMKELRLLSEGTRMHGTPQGDIASTMFDYALVHDLDLPSMWMGKGSVKSFMVTSEILAFPAKRVGKELIWYLSGGPKDHGDSVDNLRHVSLFNDSLVAIDRFLMENTGKGIAKTYSEGLVTELYKVFQYLPYARDKDYQITYEKLRTDGVFGEFMLGLFTYTRKVLCKELGEKGPATPSSFNKEFRGIVDRIAEEGPGEFERIPREWRGTTRTPMSSKERKLVDMGAKLESQYGTAEKPKPILHADEDVPSQRVSPHLKNDIDRNWNVEVTERLEYVPSGFSNPDYRSFNDQQRRYYTYWRGQTRKGVYGETDTGYVWLYLCELVNITADHQQCLDQLIGLYRAYGQADKDKLISKTCYEYAVLHKLVLPDPSIYESNLTACMCMDQFLEGKPAHPDKNLLLFLSAIDDKTISREFDADCVGITCLALTSVNDALKADGTNIKDYCNPQMKTVQVVPYGDLKNFSMNRKVNISSPDFIYNSMFNNSLKEIVKTVFSAVRMKRTGKPVKIPKCTAFGIECKDILTKSVSAWYESKEIAEIKERASNLKLDREAVSEAHAALKEVTTMMKTEIDEASVEQVKAPIEPTRKIADSWKGLAEALNDDQKGYLSAALEGKASAFLREKGIIMARMEDSINGIAMDSVGDSIVENGEVFEEYADNVRSCL